ncbi:GPI transamidase component PIG-S [Orchesella cincta]|uniref:GPI transamidase component PIG-S n=1 Tax=Orchesella cincta TaxID=48709 RepID=A0A1D2NH14_ORCCI|nr:GPI transamidase component PIG-S [Orchesella cincta]
MDCFQLRSGHASFGDTVWWKTTTVQRVPLPYYDMLTLHDQFQNQLLIGIPVQFKGFSSQLEKQEVESYQNISGYSFQFSYSVMSAAEMEMVYKSTDLYHIDRQMCAVESQNKDELLKVYYVGRADLLKEYGQQIILGNCRSVYYIGNKSQIDPKRVDKLLLKLIGATSELQVQDTSNVKDSLQLPLSAGYDILLSLLVPEPETLESTWEIQRGVKDYLDPMVKKLSRFAEFTVRSQVLYYVKLNVMPRLNSRTGIYEIPNEQLPLVINPVESKLSSFVSQNPALNFLTYTAPCDKYPLQILDETGSGLATNAFLVPQWGGIFIYNAPCPQQQKNASLTSQESEGRGWNAKHEVSMEQVMAVVLNQFRSLIGLSNKIKEDGVLDFRGSALRDWEVDLLVRKRLRSLLFTSANTLQSLGNLLDQITNIVVTEKVGWEVEKSVQLLKEAFDFATRGSLAEGQAYALEAFKSSEIAFHHPTNLAQLYFPDDQKYAIYIPLFLPVGIPVLLSLRIIFAALKKGSNKVKAD